MAEAKQSTQAESQPRPAGPVGQDPALYGVGPAQPGNDSAIAGEFRRVLAIAQQAGYVPASGLSTDQLRAIFEGRAVVPPTFEAEHGPRPEDYSDEDLAARSFRAVSLIGQFERDDIIPAGVLAPDWARKQLAEGVVAVL